MILLNRKARRRLLVAAAVVALAFAAGAVVLVADQAAYYRQVSELTHGDHDGETVQVGGTVVPGTVTRDADGAHFTILDLTGRSDTVHVVYDGQMPNAFAPGADVVVIGAWDAGESEIRAETLQTKCPSKYQAVSSPNPSPGP